MFWALLTPLSTLGHRRNYVRSLRTPLRTPLRIPLGIPLQIRSNWKVLISAKNSDLTPTISQDTSG
jgi:hypothetical protein